MAYRTYRGARERDYLEVYDLVSARGYTKRLGILNQNKRYREALEFYADEENYEYEMYEVVESITDIECEIINDGGLQAYEALKEIKGGK